MLFLQLMLMELTFRFRLRKPRFHEAVDTASAENAEPNTSEVVQSEQHHSEEEGDTTAGEKLLPEGAGKEEAGGQKGEEGEEAQPTAEGGKEGTEPAEGGGTAGEHEETVAAEGEEVEPERVTADGDTPTAEGASTKRASQVKGTEEPCTEESHAEEAGPKKSGTEDGESEKLGTVEGESEKLGTVEGESEKVGTVEEESEKVGTEEGESEKQGTEEGESEKIGTVEGESEKVGTEEGESEKVGTEEGESEKLGTEEGESEKLETEEAGTEEMVKDSASAAFSGKSRAVSIKSVSMKTGSISLEGTEEVTGKYDRQALLDRYFAAVADRELTLCKNLELQQKLNLFFRSKKEMDPRERVEYGKTMFDQDQRYIGFMAEVERLQELLLKEKEGRQQLYEVQKGLCDKCLQRVELEHHSLMELKRQVGSTASYRRSGGPISPEDIEQYFLAGSKKEAEVSAVRLESIKLQQKKLKLENTLRSKDELGEGLHLIDFEQLKVENQSLNEKIEERNEELRRLRQKISRTVHVLTHVKMKMQYMAFENKFSSAKLHGVEVQVSQKRDGLTRMKQARDVLRVDNNNLHQKGGLLGNKPLLRDFEERQNEVFALQDRLRHLQTLHAELTLLTKQVRSKVELSQSAEQLPFL
ncbi:cilia- and flagella-associated protein 184-like [Babylonia areolata]|uniref:cilia- and flagella-associated protein 184-like n=1 Tax=Babylonia areolata TaxID=304850 RepID=UPI003FD2C339